MSQASRAFCIFDFAVRFDARSRISIVVDRIHAVLVGMRYKGWMKCAMSV